ncbi:MAG: hypothetical protein GOV01_00985 [Candidatus Altiarchaeota archaeon]|nr:hypothetical protein [Candidatus Altiarchaeota archaeon]
MKGITPVITTVLLLLMAVAAVGGAWVWYQRMQTSAMAGGTGQVDNLKKTAVSISPDILECSVVSDANIGKYNLTLGNVGSESVTLTEIVLKDASSTVGTESTAANLAFPANQLTMVSITNSTACITGTTYYISARIGAQYIIRNYPITSET